MIKIIGFIAILILTTSYTKPQSQIKFDYDDQIKEIEDNLNSTKKDLNEVRVIINNPETLKKVKYKIKNQ